MNPDYFVEKSLDLGGVGGQSYHYIHVPPTDTNKATLAFFHGFPSTAYDWRHQLKYFLEQGWGIFAPDMLGYGRTSKPNDVSEYRFRLMVENMIKILDHEAIGKIHGVSHDFGSHFMSRLFNYHADRFLSLTFISVPYSPSGVAFDLDQVNFKMENLIGMKKFGYMQFLASDRSSDLVKEHLKSFHSLVYEADADVKADNFYPPGKLEAWLESNRFGLQSVLSDEEERVWMEAFGRGGMRGPTNWYRALTCNVNKSEEDELLQQGQLSITMDVPVLGIDSQPDKASVPGFMEASMKSYAASLKLSLVETQGHWPHIVAYKEVNRLILEHIQSITM